MKNMTLTNYLIMHCHESMENALSSERYPLWKRACPELEDTDFIRLGLLRCFSAVDSGRHFLQTMDEIQGELIPHSTYFKSLKSSRRVNMLAAIEKQSYLIHSKVLSEQGVNYLKSFPELDDYTVDAADGHFMDHACHTEKGDNGKVYAAGFIYAMNLRNGLLRPLCCITSGTKRHHEIPVLRRHLEKHNNKKQASKKQLYVYDKAVTDYAWWNQQKAHNHYMISVLKENSVARLVESIAFDKKNEINRGIEGYSLYDSNGITFNVVDYRDPETQKRHRFISTLPVSINPGTIAMLYYKRWTIEKAFNNSKSNLKETKAWSSDRNSLNNQMRFTAMAYNLLRVLEELSKRQQAGFIHPSDKKYTETLEKRQQVAQKRGRFVNPLFFHERIVRITSYTIRAVQNAIVTGKSLLCLMSALVTRLVPRHDHAGEH